jgi:hypothetical protein
MACRRSGLSRTGRISKTFFSSSTRTRADRSAVETSSTAKREARFKFQLETTAVDPVGGFKPVERLFMTQEKSGPFPVQNDPGRDGEKQISVPPFRCLRRRGLVMNFVHALPPFSRVLNPNRG